jgi:hypothetical protein
MKDGDCFSALRRKVLRVLLKEEEVEEQRLVVVVDLHSAAGEVEDSVLPHFSSCWSLGLNRTCSHLHRVTSTWAFPRQIGLLIVVLTPSLLLVLADHYCFLLCLHCSLLLVVVSILPGLAVLQQVPHSNPSLCCR